MATKDIRYTATLDPSGFTRGASGLLGSLTQIDTRAKGMLGSVQRSIDGVVGRFGGWVGVISGLGASLGALSFAGMIKGAIEGAAGLQDVREQSGLSIGMLNSMREVAALSGTALSDVGSLSVKLAQNLSTANAESAGAAQGLRYLGIEVDAFKRMSADDRMTLLAKRIAELPDNADRAAVAVAILGKRGAEAVPFLLDLAEAGEVQARITDDQVDASDELDKNLRRLTLTGTAWKQELAMGMVPALNLATKAVLDVFSGTGGLREQIRGLVADGSIERWTQNAVRGLTYALDAAQWLTRGVRVLGDTVGAAAAQTGALFGGIGKALSGDISGALADWRQLLSIGREWQRTVRDTMSAPTLGGQIRDRMDSAIRAAESAWGREARDPTKPPGKPFSASSTAGGGAAAKQGDRQGRLPEWEAQLAERKLQLAELANAEGSFREMSKAEEAAYWQAILARTDLTVKEQLAVRRKAAQAGLEMRKEQFDAEMETLRAERDAAGENYAERVRIATEAHRRIAAAHGDQSKEARRAYADVLAEQRKFVAQQQALDLLAADSRRAVRQAELELERVTLQEKLALGTLGRVEVLAAERNLEQQLHQIRLQGLQERRALIDPARDPEAFAQASAQIEQLELQHQQRMAQIAQQVRLQTLSPVTDTMRSIEGAWTSLISNFLKGSLTIGGLLRGIFSTAAEAVIQTMAKMAAEWMVRQVAMRLFAKVGAAGDIAREAGKAGAGGVASMAAAPFPLNLGAPAFGAAMASAAMAFAPMASAARGFDIPFGVNPITQLHAQEMVLPREQADVIRALARGGSAAQGTTVQQNYRNEQHFHLSQRTERRTQLQIGQTAYEAGLDAWQRSGA